MGNASGMDSIKDRAWKSIERIHSDLISAILHLRDPALRVIASEDVVRQLSLQVMDASKGVELCKENILKTPDGDET